MDHAQWRVGHLQASLHKSWSTSVVCEPWTDQPISNWTLDTSDEILLRSCTSSIRQETQDTWIHGPVRSGPSPSGGSAGRTWNTAGSCWCSAGVVLQEDS